jgi:UDP-3-O-[3-hydroxymyristoyl] N-acetylglucosamine deacetylase
MILGTVNYILGLVNDFKSMKAGMLATTQFTLNAPFEHSGVGLHTGLNTRVRVMPAPKDQGRVFVRVDLPDTPIVPAHIHQVRTAQLSTELASATAAVRTVEHLLAALAGTGIDNARIEVDGPEIPLMDGSAHVWVESILAVGLVEQPESRPLPSVSQPIWVRHDDAFVAAIPAPSLRFTYGIDFEVPAIANQWHSWAPNAPDSFKTHIAPARTFGLAHQVESLRAQGLIRGGSLENALVCGPEGWLNPPLRFENEPVRHKLLDLIGDLSLLGTIPQAHYLAYKASHALHLQLARELLTQLSQQPDR